ncbi:DUF6531 domain-containing protein [Bacillus velezensis]|uniref:DUF6531 domain-containing protein n=1 Tax=Bacillus velezensis TaxID=492670 RepID=UPI002FFF3261
MSGAATPTILGLPSAPTGQAYPNVSTSQSGYVNLNWPEVKGADGYVVWIYNGISYEAFDVGDTNSWTTQHKGIWPTQPELDAGRKTLHHPSKPSDTNYGGTELPITPWKLYAKNGTTYATSPYYYFRVSAYNDEAETVYSPTMLKTQITSVPFLGTEDYWSFVDVPGGSVNTATGNLVVPKTDFSLSGKGPGLTIDRTYNSHSTIKGLFGIGWHSNLDTSLKIVGNEAVYVDEDGTLHTFLKDTNGVYQPPTGVYLTLTETSTELQLKDTSQNIVTYDKATGTLKRIEDGRNLKTIFNYTNNQLTSITDASNRSVAISYHTNGYIKKLSLLGSREINYEYTGDQLTNVTGTKGEITKYVYNDEKQLVQILDPTINTTEPTTTITYQGDKVASSVDPLERQYKLTYDVTAVDKNLTVTFPDGKRNQYWYNVAANPTKIIEDVDGLKTTTIYQYEGNHLIESYDPNDVGKSPTETYEYDKNGNTDQATSHYGTEDFGYNGQNNLTYYEDTESRVSTTVYDGLDPISENDVTNAFSSYTKFDSYGNPTQSSFSLSAGTNLVKNGSFQNGLTSWVQGASVNDSGSLSIGTDGRDRISGNQSLKLTSQSTSSESGTVFAYQTISIIKEHTNYTLSADVKTDLIDANAGVKVVYLNESGTTLGSVTSQGNSTGTQGWSSKQVTFKTPPGTTQVQIRLEVNHSAATGSGAAWFDSVQLEKSEVRSAYNPIENAGFENRLTSWAGTGTGGVGNSVIKFDGYQSLKIVRTSSTAETNEYKQTIKIGQKSDDKPIDIALTGLSKAQTVQVNGTKVPANYALKAVIHYTDGTSKTMTAPFLEGTHDWSRSYEDIENTKPINTIDVSIVFGGNFTGTTWFDGIRLIQGKQATSRVYDEDGNYVTETKDQSGHSIQFETDSFGNTKKVTDSMGISKTYAYDNGNLLKTTGPLQDVTSNKYDVNGRLIESVFPSGKKVSYAYDGTSRMKSMAFNQTEVYAFGYDTNGNNTSTVNQQTNRTTTQNYDTQNRVTNQTISNQGDGMGNSVQSWIYPSNSDKLTSYSFTQGTTSDTTSYTYNQLDQNTVTTNTGKQYISQFDERGNLRSYIAGNNTTHSYEYSNRNFIDSIRIQLENRTTVLGIVTGLLL